MMYRTYLFTVISGHSHFKLTSVYLLNYTNLRSGRAFERFVENRDECLEFSSVRVMNQNEILADAFTQPFNLYSLTIIQRIILIS